MLSGEHLFNVDNYTNDMLKELPFYISYGVKYTDFRMNFHSHNGYELFFLHEGTGNYLCGELIYPLQGDDLLMIDEHELHKAAPRPGLYKRTVINFLPEFIQPGSDINLLHMFSAVNRPEYRHLKLSPEQHAAVFILLERMNEEFTERRPDFEHMLRIYLKRLLLEVYHLHASRSREPHHASVNQVNPKIKDIVQYLSQHYAEDITLEELSKKFYLDPYYLCHLFKKTTGETIRQFVLFTRIHHAKVLLILTDLPISEIAAKVGFSNFSYFGAIFKRQEGVVPRTFRQKWGRSNQKSPGFPGDLDSDADSD
ncbi:MAG: hypothetical protein K0Q59_1107 [Paenibacillus sp.]|jgi:AraC-like DNA-binding protein|nr:hypothetical protein [Paenibacillus sp.]